MDAYHLPLMPVEPQPAPAHEANLNPPVVSQSNP